MSRKLALAFALAASALPAGAREPGPTKLQAGIDRILDRPAFAAAFWGVEVRSLRSGRVLYARNAAKNFKPASTLKLLATAAALDAFGPDERVRTSVETTASLDGFGRLLGDVYLVGRGDADLPGQAPEGRASTPFGALADTLRDSGVERIEGRLVGHEGLFTGERRGADWAWDDLVWCYGAEVSALSFNDNCVDLRAAPGERPGEPLLVDARPRSAYYEVVSTATTSPAGSKGDLTLVRGLGTNRILLSGSHPMGEPPWQGSVALEDPARYAATAFVEALEARGIRVTGGAATSSEPLPEALRVLAAYDGPPLAETLKGINKPSQNLHTEMLLRLLGARVKGEGSLAKGEEALQEFLLRSGVALEPSTLRDASGLSRSDLIAPHALVNLLVAMDKHPHARVFLESLPVAGVDGTLKNRMKSGPARGRVMAKTGSIRNVNALAGYVTTRGGERLAFSIVVNHHTLPGAEATAAIDAVAALLAGS